MSGANTIPPIPLRFDGAENVQRTIDAIVARIGQMETVSKRASGSVGALGTELDRATGATRNMGQVIGQAGFQVNDFAVQVAGGQSALTAFIQQGSQLAGMFGPAGAVAGAALAIGGIGAQFLLAGESAQQMQRRAEAAFKGMNDAATQTRDLLAEVNALFLSANQNAANAANQALATTREGLLRQQSIAVQLQEGAVVELGPARQALREAEARAATELNRRLQSLEGRRAEAEGRQAQFIAPFEEQMRQDLFRPTERVLGLEYEISRQGSRSGQIAEALQRLDRFGTFDASLPAPPVPPANGGVSGGGGGAARRDPNMFGPLDGSPQSLQRLERGRIQALETESRDRERREREEARALERREAANRRVTDSIVSYGADRFADLFEANGRGWQGMLETFEQTAKSTIARIAAEMIIRPIVAPIVEGLGLGGGGAGILGGSTVGAGAGGAGSGGLGGILNLGRSGSGGLLGNVGGIINSPIWTSGGGWFGAGAVSAPSIAGLSPGAAMAGLPATPTFGLGGSTGTGGLASLGGASLGNYAAGIGGGYMAGSLVGGLIAGNSSARQTNSQIGAGGGAVAGAIIGSVVPGIGTVVGGLVGGLIGGAGGGLIGPGRGFSGGDVGVAVDANGFLTLGHVGGKNWNGAAARDQTTAGLNSINDVLRGVGISISGLGGTQLGYQGYGGSTRQFGPTEIFNSVRGSLASPNNTTVAAALAQPWLQSFEDISVIAPFAAQNDNLNRALASGGIRSRDDFNNASTFITQVYEPLSKATSAATAFADAMAEQNKVFDDAIAKARELGLAEVGLISARDRAQAETLARRDTSVHNVISGITIEELRRSGSPADLRRAANMEYSINARGRQTELQDFLTQQGYGPETSLYQSATSRLGALLDAGRSDALASVNDNAGRSLMEELTIGGLGGLTSAGRYAAARQSYAAARESGSLERITAAGRNLATVGRDYLGTSERFGRDIAGISRDVRRAGGDPDGLGVFLEGQAQGNQTLERIYSLNNLQVTELKGMRAEISRLNAVITTLMQRQAA